MRIINCETYPLEYRRFFLYGIFNDGECLYVGVTKNPVKRAGDHRWLYPEGAIMVILRATNSRKELVALENFEIRSHPRLKNGIASSCYPQREEIPMGPREFSISEQSLLRENSSLKGRLGAVLAELQLLRTLVKPPYDPTRDPANY